MEKNKKLTAIEARKKFDESLERQKNPFGKCKIRSVGSLIKETAEIEYLKTDTLLDDLLGEGIPKNSLTLLLGGTGDGKSLLLAHLAAKLSGKFKILYLSFENNPQTDASRFKDCRKTYDEYKEENITYLNILEEELFNGFEWKEDYIDKLNDIDDFDMIFIDAIQTTVDSVSQDEIHSKGNVFIKKLYKLAFKSNLPLFITWQGARAAAAKKLKEISLDDLSGSIGTARYSTNIFYIKREEGDRCLKLLKARDNKKAKWDNPSVNLELSLDFSVNKIIDFDLIK